MTELSKIIKKCNARINSFEFLKNFFCEDSHGSKKSSAHGLEHTACTICIFYETRWRDVELSIAYLTCRALLYIYTLRSKVRQIKPPALELQDGGLPRESPLKWPPTELRGRSGGGNQPPSVILPPLIENKDFSEI